MAAGETPVSWYLIAAGWEVVDRDGEAVGRVEEVVGDSTHDIFDGLSVATNLLGKPRYVPAEEVAEITEGTVRLALSQSDVESLSEYREPPTTAQVEPEGAGVVRRVEAAVEAPVRARPEREPLLRRIALRLRARFRRP